VWCKNCAENKLTKIKVEDAVGTSIATAFEAVSEWVPGAQSTGKAAKDFFGIYDYKCKCGGRLSGKSRL